MQKPQVAFFLCHVSHPRSYRYHFFESRISFCSLYSSIDLFIVVKFTQLFFYFNRHQEIWNLLPHISDRSTFVNNMIIYYYCVKTWLYSTDVIFIKLSMSHKTEYVVVNNKTFMFGQWYLIR